MGFHSIEKSGSWDKLKLRFAGRLVSLILIFSPTMLLSQKATRHYIAPAPWQYWSSANEVVITTLSKTPVTCKLKKSNGSLVATLSTSVFLPAVYRFPANPVGVQRHPLNAIIKDGGLIVESDKEVYVNLRNVASDALGFSGDQYIKGNAAMVSFGNQGLGLRFRLGYYRSDFTGLLDGEPIYGILAVNDNTQVNLNGSLLVNLKAGECYLFKSGIGGLIETTAPISMTSSAFTDAPGSCGDGVFDQIPPLTILGQNYLIVRGNGTPGTNSVYPEQTTVVATEDNTKLTIRNFTDQGTEILPAPSPVTLNAGQFHTFHHGDAQTVYSSSQITSSSNIAVYSGSANTCEVDMSSVPPISSCSGSDTIQNVKFTNYNGNDLPYLGFVIIQDALEKVYADGKDIELLSAPRTKIGNTGFYLLRFTHVQLGSPAFVNITSKKKITVSFIQQGQGFSMSSYFSIFNDSPLPAQPKDTTCTKITLTAEPGLSPYQWYFNDVLIPGANSQNIDALKTGNYSYAGMRSCGLTANSAPVNIDLEKAKAPMPQGESVQSFCYDAIPYLSDLVVTGTNIRWYDAATAGNQLTGIIKLQDNKTYYASQQPASCEGALRLSVKVDIKDKPAINIAKSSNIDCNHTESRLSAHGGGSYEWTPTGGLDNSKSPTPLCKIAVSTQYQVTVTDTAGCVATDSILVKVISSKEVDAIRFPNAFTPNGDGVNECFRILNPQAIETLDLRIYNRWGATVFESKDVNECWDGRSNGTILPGTYVYLMKALTSCGTIERKGLVELIR